MIIDFTEFDFDRSESCIYNVVFLIYRVCNFIVGLYNKRVGL